MKEPFVMYRSRNIDKTLSKKFMTGFVRNAQIEELKNLKIIIEKMYSKNKKLRTIIDIGVGDARMPIVLSKTSIWNKIKLYIGIDNSKIEIIKSNKIIKSKNKKVKIIYFDASLLNKKHPNEIFKHKYDLIICTYFTPGNFKPDQIKIKADSNGLIVPYPESCLNPNRKFIKIFKSAYRMLNSGGKIILGSTYIDNDSNRIRQEEFYKKCGMTIITSRKDSFTATKEGFWSQRFTKDRIYEYFPWLNKKSIKFVPLDKYNFAQMIVISK